LTQTPDPEDSDAPIQNFSNCHVGIIGRLAELDRLPALLDAAAQARRVAADTLQFFRDVVLAHHAEEEHDLFPAVLASATEGDERDYIVEVIQRLAREHREVEAEFASLEPTLKAAAKGHEAALDAAAVATLVQRYREHARYEEEQFLPLSQAILSRNPDHMAAQGLTLHMRHVTPDVLRRYGMYL
jgi:hemerythrin-like domain-containing protein